MRCSNCNSLIPDRSNFCHVCGERILDRERYNPYLDLQQISAIEEDSEFLNIPEIERENLNTYIKKSTSTKTILIAIVAILFISVIATTLIKPKPTLEPKPEPSSGTILMGAEVFNGSEITVTASDYESCVVKLKDSSGTTIISFFVREGETARIGIPGKYLYAYFAMGDTWYGEKDLFGEDTSYSMDEEGCDYSQYTLEYTLSYVDNGNFSETPIDSEDFW